MILSRLCDTLYNLDEQFDRKLEQKDEVPREYLSGGGQTSFNNYFDSIICSNPKYYFDSKNAFAGFAISNCKKKKTN